MNTEPPYSGSVKADLKDSFMIICANFRYQYNGHYFPLASLTRLDSLVYMELGSVKIALPTDFCTQGKRDGEREGDSEDVITP